MMLAVGILTLFVLAAIFTVLAIAVTVLLEIAGALMRMAQTFGAPLEVPDEERRKR